MGVVVREVSLWMETAFRWS